MKSDPYGYYAAIGVSSKSSQAEIKSIYRALVKIYHPDVNPGKAAEEKFRQIQEAYEVIGDEHKRAVYDTIGDIEESTVNNGVINPNFDIVEPIRCSVCKKITAQPRFIIFKQVTSLIFVTITTPKSGIFCSACATKQAIRSTAITAVFGWWGIPWGPINTISSIFGNAFGGVRKPDIDDQLLWHNTIAFFQHGEYELAASLANRLKSALDKNISEEAKKIIKYT